MPDEFTAATEAAIARWHGITAPNPTARATLDDLESLIAELAALRDGLRFEDEPSGFDAALLALREPG